MFFLVLLLITIWHESPCPVFLSASFSNERDLIVYGSIQIMVSTRLWYSELTLSLDLFFIIGWNIVFVTLYYYWLYGLIWDL
jgi:hypothetical protein